MWKEQKWRCCVGATSFVPVPPNLSGCWRSILKLRDAPAGSQLTWSRFWKSTAIPISFSCRTLTGRAWFAPERNRLISGLSATGTLWPLTGRHILGRCKPSSADVRNRGAFPPSSSLIEPPDDLCSDSDLERGDQSGRLPGIGEVERRSHRV